MVPRRSRVREAMDERGESLADVRAGSAPQTFVMSKFIARTIEALDSGWAVFPRYVGELHYVRAERETVDGTEAIETRGFPSRTDAETDFLRVFPAGEGR